jgi:hypothetical protein
MVFLLDKSKMVENREKFKDRMKNSSLERIPELGFLSSQTPFREYRVAAGAGNFPNRTSTIPLLFCQFSTPPTTEEMKLMTEQTPTCAGLLKGLLMRKEERRGEAEVAAAFRELPSFSTAATTTTTTDGEQGYEADGSDDDDDDDDEWGDG